MSLPSFQDFLEKTACYVVAYDSLWTFHVHVEDVFHNGMNAFMHTQIKESFYDL